MAEFPALPLWTDAYLGDTTHLTTIEHGAYLLLLMTAWRSRDCRLPDDDRLLARYARCNAGQWKRLRPIIEPFFVVENGFWWQRRLTDEAAVVRQKKEAAAANGRASALKRQGRHSTERDALLNGATNEPSTKKQLNQSQSHVPLDKSNGGNDPEKQFWADAKSYLQPHVKSDPGALIQKWLKERGKDMTRAALGAAQLERAVDPVAYVSGYFRRNAATASEPVWDGMP